MGKSILLAASTLKFEGTDSFMEKTYLCTVAASTLKIEGTDSRELEKSAEETLHLPLNLKVLTACKSKRADTQKYKVVSE